MADDIMWHVIEPGQTIIRQSDEALRNRINGGTVTRETMVWRPGMDTWRPAGEIAGLFIAPPLPCDSAAEVASGAPDSAASPRSSVPTVGEVHSADASETSQAVEHRKPQKWYVMRHWRGELSLGVSYWISGAFVALLGWIINTLVADSNVTKAPRLISSFYALAALIPILAGVWLAVGNWRSAGHSVHERHRQGKRAFWAYLVRILVIIQLFFIGETTFVYSMPNMTANLKIAFGGDALPHHVLRLLNGGTEIALTGGFDFGTAADLQQLLSNAPGVKTIDFNSIGGRVAEAERVRVLIHQRGLATYTAGLCASACTLAFIGGNPRLIGPSGKLGFHRYSFPGLTPDQDGAMNLVGQQSLVNADVTPEFAAKVFSTPSSGIWFPDPATLRSANVITQQVDGLSFSFTANGEVTAEQIEKILNASPGFVALKRADLAMYTKAYQSVLAGGQQGATVRQTWATAESLLQAAVARYRLVASNEIQFQVAVLMAEEGRYLAEHHPDVCLMMFQTMRWSGTDYRLLLSQDLRKRDAVLVGAIIDGGSTAPTDVVATDDSALAELGPLWIQLKNEGFDLATAGQAPRSTADQRYNCLAVSALMRNIALLPVTRLGPLMRHISKAALQRSPALPDGLDQKPPL